MAGNKNLHDSAKNKQDEFYTQLSLIESELKHYREHFKGKTVLCNCDDPYESNFFKYFAMNFNALGLKKLIATCYGASPVSYTELPLFEAENNTPHKKAYKAEITEVHDENGDGRIDLADVEVLLKSGKNAISELKGDGDFRSPECLELLKQADIVCTNPPFSLFREYIAQLMEYGKKFLILGNLNAVTYKEVLPLFMGNSVWLGYNSGHFWFKVPPNYEIKKTDFKIDETGQKWRRMGNICWFTNLDIKKRHEKIPLFRNYNPEKYPKYDNYDGIEVSKTADIPCDYFEAVGIPITFLTKYSPDQFEVLGLDKELSNDRQRFALVGKSGGGTAFICPPSGKIEEVKAFLIKKLHCPPESILERSGIMGVPVTFMTKHNPEQFEILGDSRYHDGQNFADDINFVNGKCKYTRILVKLKNEKIRIFFDENRTA